MERPKFEIGEKVAIKSILRPDLNVSRTTVSEADYRTDHPCGVLGLPYTGWVYRVSANKYSWCESALREIPATPSASFLRMLTELGRRVTTERPGVIVVKNRNPKEESAIEHC